MRTASSLLRRAASLLLAAELCSALLVWPSAEGPLPWGGNTYIVTRTDGELLFVDESHRNPDLTGYPLTLVTYGRAQDLATAARQVLTIRHEETVYTTTSKLEAVSEALRRAGTAPSPYEGVLIQVSRGAVDITVASDLIYYERDVEETAYKTIRRENPSMLKGEEAVVQVGSIGEKGGVYEVAWSNGRVLSRQLVEHLNSEPVDAIIEYGTASAPAKKTSSSKSVQVTVNRDVKTEDEGGTLTLSSGKALHFSKALSMSATAYTAGHGGVGTSTASGTPVHKGVVAVDRSVIPLGAKLYIVANGGIVYGEAVAEDTGVRGNRIDLYFETYQECIQFGRRNCMVYILE